MNDHVAIELRDVVKRFGDVNAVDHVSMQIRDGEFFSMLGPSGCGKTTTLRMIAGFEYPTSGEIDLHGKPVGTTPPFLRNVNTVFQSYALFPHMSVAENVAFGLKMKQVNPADAANRVRAALDMVQLGTFAERRPKMLSGGQQQRVALARAIVNQPEVLLLDEPLGALDLKLRKEMQLELKGIQQRLGITFIYVTHDQEEALTMSDRIAVMSGGKVLQMAPPTEIYERPSCRFVADFIGESNFIEGTVASVGTDRLVTVTTPGGLTVVGQQVSTVQPGAAVTVSVRPEKVRLTQNDPPAHAANKFRVRVERVVYIGSDTRISVLLGGQIAFDAWEQNDLSTLDRNAYWQPGEEGWLWWPAGNGLVLTE
jgi:spermidine/putrescine transport system ATP-binding protein